jgi:hypothetical protein
MFKGRLNFTASKQKLMILAKKNILLATLDFLIFFKPTMVTPGIKFVS